MMLLLGNGVAGLLWPDRNVPPGGLEAGERRGVGTMRLDNRSISRIASGARGRWLADDGDRRARRRERDGVV